MPEKTPEEIAKDLRANPNRHRRVDDQPPSLNLSAGELAELKRRRQDALAERTKLQQDMKVFIRSLPDELRERFTELQLEVQAAEKQIGDFDKLIKESNQFKSVIRDLKSHFATLLGHVAVSGKYSKVGDSVKAVMEKCAKRLSKDKAESALQIALSELIDPSVPGGRNGMSYSRFLEQVKQSRRTAAARESQFENYEREALRGVDKAKRQEDVDDMKQLGGINAKQNVKPPRQRMKVKSKRRSRHSGKFTVDLDEKAGRPTKKLKTHLRPSTAKI